MTTSRAGVPNVSRSENSDGSSTVRRIRFLAVWTRNCHSIALSEIVFATFHPCASGRASGNRRNARVENPIARCLDVFEQLRRDNAMGFVPVAEMDRLCIVDAVLLGRIPGAMYDARSAMSSVSSSGRYVIDPPPVPVPTARPRDRWRDCGHGSAVFSIATAVRHAQGAGYCLLTWLFECSAV
jgi:hypothetical protein